MSTDLKLQCGLFYKIDEFKIISRVHKVPDDRVKKSPINTTVEVMLRSVRKSKFLSSLLLLMLCVGVHAALMLAAQCSYKVKLNAEKIASKDSFQG